MNTLDLEYQAVFDDEIDAICRGESDLLVNQWEVNLVLEMQALVREFVKQACADALSSIPAPIAV